MTPLPRNESVSLDGLRFHYRDWGGTGQSIVLMHGLASTCHIWDLVAPLLSKRFAVVALDQRGHGESDKPESGYDFATVAGDIRGFVAALEIDRPILVGHSWGGNVAIECAASYPDLVRGVCLIDGGTIEISAASENTLERAREQMAPPDFSGMTMEQLEGRARSRDWGFEVTSEIGRIVSANFEVLADNTIRARLSRKNHMAIIDAFWDHKPSDLFAQVLCPTLLMPARRNAEGADSARQERIARSRESIDRANKLLPKSKVVWMEDSVHDVPLQRPELVAGTIEEHIRDGFFG